MPHRVAALCLTAWCLFQTSPAFAVETPLSIDLHDNLWRGDLDALIKHRAIRVLVPYSKTLFFVDYGGTERGLSYDFMRAFEDALNAKLSRGNLRIHCVFIPAPRDRLIPLLLEGQGDVIAANLTITPRRQREVDFVEPVAEGVREIIVTAPGAPPITAPEQLSGREVFVPPATSYLESLNALNDSFRRRHLPLIRLRFAPGNFETEDILEMVNAGLVQTVVADDYLAHFWLEIYPHLNLHPDVVIRPDGDIAFAVRKNSPLLKAELDDFTRTHKAGTLFGNVALQKYLRETRWAKNAMSPAELAKFNSLVSLFRKYGDEYQIDWLLMAAQGYQESQLDQSRRSAAGAMGVMQLTAATGRQMGVGDIGNIEANIHAGIKYVRFLADNYFAEDDLDPLNKVLFAIASYNAGPNRIRALRKDAETQHLNPKVWFDNVERVVSEHVGRETVQYVSNIYKYYIAYTLVQDDVAKSLGKSQGRPSP
jgi:membrane-bound lytic murein transglycosylase MltF